MPRILFRVRGTRICHERIRSLRTFHYYPESQKQTKVVDAAPDGRFPDNHHCIENEEGEKKVSHEWLPVETIRITTDIVQDPVVGPTSDDDYRPVQDMLFERNHLEHHRYLNP